MKGFLFLSLEPYRSDGRCDCCCGSQSFELASLCIGLVLLECRLECGGIEWRYLCYVVVVTFGYSVFEVRE